MSGGKFASLTAGLLARKGEAVPSVLKGSRGMPLPRAVDASMDTEQMSVGRDDREKLSSSDSDRSRRLMVALTPSEFETLGLIAVKKGTTRHHLLRTAFDEYLSLLVDEYGGACHCIISGCNCD